MVVHCTSPWVPLEWIRAHGLRARGTWTAEAAQEGRSLAAGVCRFAESVLERSRRRESGVAFVFTTQCDQLRRSYDSAPAGAAGSVFLFNLPATWQTPAGERMFRSELDRLGGFLESLGGRRPSARQLAQEIAAQNETRARLAALARASGGDSTAGDLELVPSARALVEAVSRELFSEPTTPETARGPGRPGREGVPLALVGGPMSRTQWHLLDAVEDSGGRIVVNGTEPGERHLWVDAGLAQCPETAGVEDLLSLLAGAYVRHCVDVYQRPNTKLYGWLAERLTARRVKGILLWHEVWCDLWRAEAETLREAFGLPVLRLDAEHLAGGALRSTGRLEAFLETLR